VRIISRNSGGVLDQKEDSFWLVTMFFAGTGFFAASPLLEWLGSSRPATPSMLMRQRRITSALENTLRARMRE
jgi:hypothetical protein